MRILTSIFFLSLCIAFTSCSNSIDDELIGEWELFMTKSDCSLSEEYNDEETLANEGCIIQTITSNSGVVTDFDFCRRLIFKESGSVDIISVNAQQSTTKTHPYETSGNTISICMTSTFCPKYNLIDGKLTNVFRVPISGTPLFDCNRTFTYQK